jgi:hypothetical protein
VLVEGGLGVVPGKETRKGEGAARVVERCDSDSMRSRVEYGVLFYFPFFPFFCNFFYFLFFCTKRGTDCSTGCHRLPGEGEGSA